MSRLLLFSLVLVSNSFICFVEAAFQQQQQQQSIVTTSSNPFEARTANNNEIIADTTTQLFQFKNNQNQDEHDKMKNSCRPCPNNVFDDENENDDDDDDISLARREAAFAMLGGLWSISALPTGLLFPNSIEAAYAEYGSDAKMDFPNVMEGMNDRVSKQCLVESLGNRECLVYMDDKENFIYKGADVQILLERIEVASKALATIPTLIEQSKWTSITGVLTGPMGTLSSTMTLLVKLSSNPSESSNLAKQVKTHIFAMGTGTQNKSGSIVLKEHQLATESLVAFVKSL